MDNPDPRNAVSRLVKLLRKITRIVQLAPFVYLLFLAFWLLCEPYLPEWVLRCADNTLNMPLYTTACMLGAGRMLKLCRWFRTACLLPLATKIEVWLDAFVVTLTQSEVVTINTCLGLIFLAYIIIANHHFFHGLKARA